MANLSPNDRVSAARIRMLQRMPFYGLLAMRLNLTPDTKTADVWVDGITLGYNPDWVNNASFDELMSAIAHGAHHLALLHHLRRCGRDNNKWQKACDVPVNAALQEGDFQLPASVHVSPGDAMKSAEEAYGECSDNEREEGRNPKKKPGDGEDEGTGKGKGKGDGEGEGEGDGDGDQESDGPAGTPGEVRDQPGKNGKMDDSELAQAESDALKDIAAAAQQAKASGFGLPGSIERQLKHLLYPSQDWRELLREFMKALAKTDYSWSRPNRRFIGSGLYLPSLHSEGELGEIVVAIDTSGSIDTRKLELFAGCLNELLEELNPEKVTVIYCSSEIERIDQAERDNYPIDIKARGCGSTSLCPPFQYVEEQGIVPEVLLYFTDLGGPSPHEEPSYPVLWLDQEGDTYNFDMMRAFGHTWGTRIPINYAA